MVRAVSNQRFGLGSWTVDLERGSLTSGETSRKLEPKVADLLRALVEANGAVVSRTQLFECLWPDVTVGDDTLTRTVFKLRRSLDDDPKDPAFVETVAKRGYRLMQAPVAMGAREPGQTRKRLVALGAAAIAVVLAALLTLIPFPLAT